MKFRRYPSFPAITTKRLVATGLAILVAALLLFVANRYMINESGDVQNVDEFIPLHVVQHMHASGTLDTDWAHSDLPEEFRRVHFNFSGYILSAYAFTRIVAPASLTSEELLLSRLRQFSRFATLALAVLSFLMLKREIGMGYAFVASIAVLLAPLTFQDAHYARPEALGTLLFTACFLLSLQTPGSRRREIVRAMTILCIAGFLTSIKLTYALAAAFALPVAYRFLPGRALAVKSTVFFPAAVLAGMACFVACAAAGAPYAFAHPGIYREGLAALRTQYQGLHPPHSLSHYSFIGESTWISSYFVGILGWPLLLLHPLGYVPAKTRPALLVFAAIASCMLLTFALQHVFFERNLSHLVPSFIIVSLIGVQWAFRQIANVSTPTSSRTALIVAAQVIAMVLVLRTPFMTTADVRRVFQMKYIERDREDLDRHIQAAESRVGADKVVDVGYVSVLFNDLPASPGCVLYKITTYRDDWSRRFVDRLRATMTIDYVRPSRFSRLANSTLYTYHSASIYLAHSDDACAR